MIRLTVRAILALAVFVATVPCRGIEIEIVSARQTTPGNLVVTVGLNGAKTPTNPGDLFIVLDDSPPIAAQSLTSAAASTAPTWVMLCLDRSGSIGPTAISELKSALTRTLNGGGATELKFKVALVAFGTRSTHLLNFTSNAAQVATAIARFGPDNDPSGKTKLHDAIAGGLAALRSEGEGSKRLIVVSDGKDEGSILSAARLGELAQTAPAIPIDAVSFGALGASNSGSLSTVAGSTGGRFMQAGNAKELEQAIGHLLAAASPGPTFTASFAYPPASDKRMTESGWLVYAAQGQPTVKRALTIPVAAVAAFAASGPPAQQQHEVQEPSSSWRFSVALKWVKTIPLVFAWPAGGALALALAMLFLRARSRERVPQPASQDVRLGVGVLAVGAPPPPLAPPQRQGTLVGYAWPAPSPGHPTAILHGVAGTARGEQFSVDKPAYRVGCSPDNDLVLIGDDFASGYHAVLRYQQQALYVEDLGSTNGSYLNGTHFKSATRSLSPGDELKFGHTVFSVLAADPHTRQGHDGLEPRVK